ncbi:phage tail protein [Morganella morganii]|nr:phage tail protein [Morganella morganii]
MSSVITTDFERWKAQEAALGKPVALNEFVFANVPGLDPSKDISRDEKLPPAGQIVHRQAVNKAGLASEKAVAYSVTLGTDVGDFVFNWIGLINKESGTLAMITHAPEQRKIKTVDGVQGNVLTRSFLLEFNGAAKETQITTSAETWQIDFTARLAGMDEIQRLANRDIYGAAAFFGDGFLVTKAAEQCRVTPGTAYIEGLRGTLEEITTFNNLRDTKIYADFTFQGNLVSKWQTFVKVTTAKTLAHYQDAAGFQHYVSVIAEIDKNGNITDKRVKGTAIDRELAELKKDLPNKYQPIGDYQPAGSYVYSDYFVLEMLKKFDKANISDQMGNNGDKVPSLRLLSEQIGKCQPKGNYAPSSVYGVSSDGSVSIKTPSGKEFYISFNGYTGIKDENGKVVWEFNPDGVLTAGTIPIERLRGYIKGIGDAQTWRVMGNERKIGITYVNTEKRPIQVSVDVLVRNSSTPVYLRYNDEAISSVASGTDQAVRQNITAIIPAGADYGVYTDSTGTLHSWSELR